jgi:nucleoside phosphorylase
MAVPEGVDVLVVAALPEEFAAARSAAAVEWRERDASAPYLWGSHRRADGRQVSVALARPTHMGGRVTGATAATLVDRLTPTCVAMCGVCAGNPADTALGDVVVAEPVYEYDEGKWTSSGFTGDHRQFRLDPVLVRAAQDLDPGGLPSYGAADADEAMLWLLERLHFEQDPRNHPARDRYFAGRTWGPSLERYEAAGLIARPDGAVALTDAGRALVRRRLYDDVDGPQRLPFRVSVAPMASGSAVIADARIWSSLAHMGMRRIAAVEMEAATIATIAHQAKVPYWLVVKGVMDHAGAAKDDRYKAFAARASAEVLYALLDSLPDAGRRTGSSPAGSRHPVTIDGAQGVQIGDHNVQRNVWGR